MIIRLFVVRKIVNVNTLSNYFKKPTPLKLFLCQKLNKLGFSLYFQAPSCPFFLMKHECGLTTCPLKLFSPTISPPTHHFFVLENQIQFFHVLIECSFSKKIVFNAHTYPLVSFLEGFFSKYPHVHQGYDELFLLPHTPLFLENRIQFFHVLIEGSFSKSFVSQCPHTPPNFFFERISLMHPHVHILKVFPKQLHAQI